ncbi:CpaF family protein [Candidatus Woesearchaeota archaeon]|nr:CpaF family protein [Candidatus Woesearchaeota archaeon]
MYIPDPDKLEEGEIILDSYQLLIESLVVKIAIIKDKKSNLFYTLSLLNLTKVTKIILEKIREEFISQVNIGRIDITEDTNKDIKERFKKEILVLINKYFPHTDQKTADLLISYIIRQNIGLGDLEILLKDSMLEEIVINSSKEPVYVYHRRFGWLRTNVQLSNETLIRHYATMIGRDVGKEITILNPIMDAHLPTGDRVHATLQPVSNMGNTITIRKFSEKPWAITDFIKANTISYAAAALLWLAVENELSILISGGTGSGKTSMLNVIANFFPPNQRIISIEDTREITLPENLHWVPMETRLPNPEGKGEVTMLDLIVGSLRMRPDRIIVGEIRRKKEAEVLFEAMHTGHSVYGTVHANNVEETIRRLTNPPIDIPLEMIPAVSLIVVQHRNRRTGKRRTLQIAEILPDSSYQILMQLDVQSDEHRKVKEMVHTMKVLNLYTGLTAKEIEQQMEEKIGILKWMVKHNITDINKVGDIMSKYYYTKTTKDFG